MSTTLRERVVAGGAFMDEKAPGWFHTVNLDVLNINDMTLCVLGQAFEEEAGKSRFTSGYSWAEASFFFKQFELPNGEQISFHDVDSMVNHGFRAYRHGFAGLEECQNLTEEWRSYILARRAAAPVNA